MTRKWTKTDPEQLVTAEEVVAIMAKAGDTEDIRRAIEVAEAYPVENKGTAAFLSVLFNDFEFMRLLSNVYQAGRIQGIREQRQKRRGGAMV